MSQTDFTANVTLSENNKEIYKGDTSFSFMNSHCR